MFGFFKRLRETEVAFQLHARDHAWTKLLEDLDARVKALEKLEMQRIREKAREAMAGPEDSSDGTGKYL